MKNTFRAAGALALALCVLILCTIPAGADDLTVTAGTDTAVPVSGFAEEDALRGIYIASVPAAYTGDLLYGSRVLRSGDVLTAQALNQLHLRPSCTEEADCVLVYRPIYSDALGESRTLKIHIRSSQNHAPVSKDLELETYKNISNTGTLPVSDADGDALTYQLVKEPRRGSVELREDGTFTYTPSKNKVGRDTFVYTATDEAGSVSEQATVTVRIVRPTDRAVYTDVAGTQDEYLAMWMKEQGLYSGRRIGECICFEPDSDVTRGEFLVMAMRLLGAEAEDTALTSGFSDELQTPVWMRPFIVSAFKSGMISGVRTQNGLEFRPDSVLTRAEAAVMLQNILQLPAGETADVFAQDTSVPVWAQDAYSALTCAGIVAGSDGSEQCVSRLECAQLLHSVWLLRQSGELAPFRWES